MRIDFRQTMESFIADSDRCRQQWLNSVCEAVDAGLALPTIHRTFDREARVDQFDPSEGFAFNSVDGRTVEAMVIGWQVQVAVAFCLNNHYLTDDSMDAFIVPLIEHLQRDTSWALSCGSHFVDGPLQMSDVARVLAHFILKEAVETEKVQRVSQFLFTRALPLLAVSTHLATALMAGDSQTIGRIKRELTEHLESLVPEDRLGRLFSVPFLSSVLASEPIATTSTQSSETSAPLYYILHTATKRTYGAPSPRK